MARNQEPLTQTSVIKLKEQDFYSLRDHCLKRGVLFEDETFPADTYSIGLQLLKGKNLSSLSWIRPKVSETPPHPGTHPTPAPGPSELPSMVPPPEGMVQRHAFQGWPKPN